MYMSKSTKMQHMLEQCTSLSSINSTEDGTFDLSMFDFKNATEVSWLISGCNSCTKAIWGDVAFKEGSSIYGFMAVCLSLVIADCSGLDTTNVSWLDEAFRGDTALTTIYCSSGLHGVVKVKIFLLEIHHLRVEIILLMILIIQI